MGQAVDEHFAVGVNAIERGTIHGRIELVLVYAGKVSGRRAAAIVFGRINKSFTT